MNLAAVIFFLSVMVYVGVIIFLIKGYDKETRKLKIYSTKDENVIAEFKKQVDMKFLRNPRKSFYWGLAFLLIGIIFMTIQFFQFTNSISALGEFQANNYRLRSYYHDYTTTFVIMASFSFFLIFIGVACVVYYYISKNILRNYFKPNSAVN